MSGFDRKHLFAISQTDVLYLLADEKKSSNPAAIRAVLKDYCQRKLSKGKSAKEVGKKLELLEIEVDHWREVSHGRDFKEVPPLFKQVRLELGLPPSRIFRDEIIAVIREPDGTVAPPSYQTPGSDPSTQQTIPRDAPLEQIITPFNFNPETDTPPDPRPPSPSAPSYRAAESEYGDSGGSDYSSMTGVRTATERRQSTMTDTSSNIGPQLSSDKARDRYSGVTRRSTMEDSTSPPPKFDSTSSSPPVQTPVRQDSGATLLGAPPPAFSERPQRFSGFALSTAGTGLETLANGGARPSPSRSSTGPLSLVDDTASQSRRISSVSGSEKDRLKALDASNSGSPLQTPRSGGDISGTESFFSHQQSLDGSEVSSSVGGGDSSPSSGRPRNEKDRNLYTGSTKREESPAGEGSSSHPVYTPQEASFLITGPNDVDDDEARQEEEEGLRSGGQLLPSYDDPSTHEIVDELDSLNLPDDGGAAGMGRAPTYRYNPRYSAPRALPALPSLPEAAVSNSPTPHIGLPSAVSEKETLRTRMIAQESSARPQSQLTTQPQGPNVRPPPTPATSLPPASSSSYPNEKNSSLLWSSNELAQRNPIRLSVQNLPDSLVDSSLTPPSPETASSNPGTITTTSSPPVLDIPGMSPLTSSWAANLISKTMHDESDTPQSKSHPVAPLNIQKHATSPDRVVSMPPMHSDSSQTSMRGFTLVDNGFLPPSSTNGDSSRRVSSPPSLAAASPPPSNTIRPPYQQRISSAGSTSSQTVDSAAVTNGNEGSVDKGKGSIKGKWGLPKALRRTSTASGKE